MTKPQERRVVTMLDELAWYAKTLKAGRDAVEPEETVAA